MSTIDNENNIYTLLGELSMKMKLLVRGCLLALGIITIISAASCSSKTASTSTVSAATTTSTVATTAAPIFTIATAAKAGIGTYLVDNKGITLYWVTLDSIGKSNITGSTLIIWPVFYAANINIPSTLNASDFNSIQRADGKMQTTYKGWPLYYYYQDLSSGNTYGQGIDGVWFAVNPASSSPSSSVTTTTTATTSVTTLPATTTTGSYGY